ncbi:type III polyketide synthase [Saxibacter everestensis]|uniref:Type III polyketide synthase n=1 Tax=Saxibacter everestensis TaxID=2909229 RepID=A0ABY8QSL5_9MICO|nr:type III polyketide synthase [Brevibacteriaceae bacterium ZFBP1038]
MSVYIRSIETAVPTTVLQQDQTRDAFAAQPGLGRLGQRLIHSTFSASGIERRYSVIDDFDFEQDRDLRAEPVFFDRDTAQMLNPGTAIRNRVYTSRAAELFVEAGKRALKACDGIDAADVTHVVTVSCTGFFAPGPDFMLVRELGLAPTVSRQHLGFMGCYASLPALRVAADFCRADPDAVVLVVSTELCTLHVRVSNDPDTIVASSVFADGAGAAVVTAKPPGQDTAALRIDRFGTVITPVGEGDMAWTIGDHGFEMVLSKYVPHIIDEHILGALEPLLAEEPELARSPKESVRHWAIHPGGRSILDKVEAKLGLSEAQLIPSRDTLRDYGNMSSATILFVLKHILDGRREASLGAILPGETGPGETLADESVPDRDERVAAMAFGPGLTVETALLTRLPAVATG